MRLKTDVDVSNRHHQHGSHRTLSRLLNLLILLALSLLLPPVLAAPECLRSADARKINQAFIDGGPGKQVFLCPSKTYHLREPIIFTAAEQELATQGYPTGSERATLVVAGDFATIIQGDCRRCTKIKIRSLVIDGNRKNLGRIPNHRESTGLVVIGGNTGQSIQHCHLRDPRGYTAIHVREGDNLDCSHALIEKNEIGPVGEEYIPSVDGPDPESAPSGRPLADGVSIACKDSIIRDNNFYDNTDAAIVVYCAPGTLIHANSIMAQTMSAMAGILMVDATPFDGDYKLTTVKGNIIDAANRIIRVGIGIGAAVLSDDTETVLTGGRVLANGLRGKYMGFGIAAAGLDDWIIKDNWDEAGHVGVSSDRCFEEPINPGPMAFVRHNNIKGGELQKDFVEQPFEYVVCIDEPTDMPLPRTDLEPADIPDADAQRPVVPPHLADVQDGSVQAPLEEKPGYATGSEVMDEILEHSQQRMLDAIGALGRRVDVLADTASHSAPDFSQHEHHHAMDPIVGDALAELQSRIDRLETRQQALLEAATTMRKTIRAWDQQLTNTNEWQYDVLLDVSHKLNEHLRHTDSGEIGGSSGSHDVVSNSARLLRSIESSSLGQAGWRGAVWPSVGLGIVAILGLGVRRILRRRAHTKVQ